MTEHLKTLYRNYIRHRVEDNYLTTDNFTVLGENFVKSYYFAVIQKNSNTLNQENNEYYLIVENCRNPLFIKLEQLDKSDKYIKLDKQSIAKDLPHKILHILAEQGLCTTAYNTVKKGNNPFTLHRLVLCLYKNILGLTVHHNDKIKTNNYIGNLTPIAEREHYKLDTFLKGNDFIVKTNEYHTAFCQELFKKKNNTLASRDNTVLAILYMLDKNIPVKNIAFGKCKKTKIYEYKRHYFYLKDFINCLKSDILQASKQFYGIQISKWVNILNFEKEFTPNRTEIIDFLADTKTYLKSLDKIP